MRHVRFENSVPPRESFFQKRDPFGHGFALWVVALMIFVAPLSVMVLRHVRMDNNVENWLPDNDPSAQEYAWCRGLFPEEDNVVLTWEHSSIDDPRLPLLVGKLRGKVDSDGERRGHVPYVSSVMHAGDLLARMVQHGVPQAEAVRRLEGTFLGPGRVKVRLTPAALESRELAIRSIRQGARDRFGIQLEVFDAYELWQPSEEQSPFFEELNARQAVTGASSSEVPRIEFAEHHLQLGWSGMSGNPQLREELMDWMRTLQGIPGDGDLQDTRLVEDCFIQAGTPIAVLVGLSESGMADRGTAIAAIRQAATAALIPQDKLIVGGRVVASVELNSGVLKAAWNPQASLWHKKSVILLSGLVGIIFALASLRSIRLGLLVIGVSYYAALLGVAQVPLSGGSMNMVLIVMPTLLMVLALSGAIHIANYWKHAVWEDPSTAVVQATRMASQPCLMAAFTTALGLISLAGSQLRPVREFGVYAAVGALISVAMVLYGLPSLLQMAPLRRVRPDEIHPRRWLKFGDMIHRRWKPLTIAYVVMAIFSIYGLKYFQVETKVIKYFPGSSPVVQAYEEIEETLAGISPVEIIVRFDHQAQREWRFLERMEIVRRIEEEIRNHPEVSGTLSLADFQPVRDIPGEQASTREKIFFNRRSNETEKRIKAGTENGASEFIAMDRAGDRPAHDGYGSQDSEDNAAELWRISAQAAVLSDADYNHLTGELSERVQSVATLYPGMDHVVTGTVPLFLRTQRAVLESLIWSFVLAFGLIALVMMWVLKDPLAGALSMLPNLLPVLSVFGLVSWFGQRIDIGTMVTASVALGIAVDGTLHLLTWFRDGLERGHSRYESMKNALSHCGPAMWQTSAAVGLGLLVLLPADLLLISRFGWLMASLIAAALIADVVLLPCLLVGPLGQLIEYRMRRRQSAVRPADENPPRRQPVIPSPHLPLTAPVESEESRCVG